MRHVSPAIWATIRRHWCLGTYTSEDLSRIYRVHASTVRRRAASENWPERASAFDDTEMFIRVSSDDALHVLNAKTVQLRADTERLDKPELRDLRATIRLAQQAINALRDMQRDAVKSAAPAAPPDAKQAKAALLAKFFRMKRSKPEPPLCPSCQATASSSASSAGPTPPSGPSSAG